MSEISTVLLCWFNSMQRSALGSRASGGVLACTCAAGPPPSAVARAHRLRSRSVSA